MSRLLLAFCVSTSMFFAAAPQPEHSRRPLVFEPNQGQAPESVKWIARASGYQLLLTTEGATIMFPEGAGEDLLAYSTIRMKLSGGHPWSVMEGLQPTGGASNYFLGSDRKRWHTGIPHYAQLSAPRVYDGIDLVFYSNGGDLEYDFVVAPDADPKQIRLAFDGVDRMRVDGQSGDLLLTTTGGSELRHLRPKVYQQVGDERVEVASSYQILDRRHATFMLASYDRRRTLVIDPAVGFTAFLAGKKSDVASALAVDSSGNAYVTGSTYSIDFPRTGPPPTTQNPLDAFVTKLSPTGAIVFSNYLGGSDSDQGFGIAVDTTGVFATGITVSTDFPTQAPIFPQRGIDAYVTKFSPDGNVLVYSTYLGGSGQEHGNGIAVDSAHAAWVVGTTDSSDFPIFGGPNAGQQRTHGGGFDAFLAKIAPSGMSVAFSTYAGGQGDDKGYSVAVDSTGSVYATGSGASKFPITTGMRPCGTSGGAFAVRLKGIGTQTRYATCLPHAEGAGIAVDANFNAYLTGIAYDDFPTTPGAYQRTKPTPRNSGLFTAFVAKLTSSGGVAYSTYLGGTSGITFARGIAVTRGGIAYVGGGTSSTDFPGLGDLKVNPTGGFLLKLTPQGNAPIYTMRVGAAVEGVGLFQLGRMFPQQVYMAGYRYTGGTNNDKLDAFVVKTVED